MYRISFIDRDHLFIFFRYFYLIDPPILSKQAGGEMPQDLSFNRRNTDSLVEKSYIKTLESIDIITLQRSPLKKVSFRE
jgi:hypothetical protein